MKRIVRHGQRQRDAARALEDACRPLEDALYDAKEAYWKAVESGDPAAIREAKKAKQEAAARFEETRTWLRREAEIVKLQTRTIPRLEQILAKPMLTGKDAREDAAARAEVEAALAAAKAELETALAAALPLRQQLEQFGETVDGGPVPPDLPPGSADVSLPAVTVRGRARRTNERG